MSNAHGVSSPPAVTGNGQPIADAVKREREQPPADATTSPAEAARQQAK
jgi:hypothetical protein